MTLWEQKDSITVHLVNLTNPMAMKGPYRQLIPAPPQKMSLRLPPGKRPKNVRLLVANQSPASEFNAGVVSLTVPTIVDQEVVAIDL